MNQQLTKDTACPNCYADKVIGHKDTAGCVLHALLIALGEREEHSDEEILEIHAKVNVDKLWEDLGPILDRLSYGGYDTEEED